MHYITQLVRNYHAGSRKGIYSCCSSSKYVIRAGLLRAKRAGVPFLVEATANQVNQFGGYTGMKPKDFRNMVEALAAEVGFPTEQLILGGDHLGPLTWCDLPEKAAMPLAADLIREYVAAGFTKIHIDTSMMLADDDPSQRLSDEVIARRGAFLCHQAEDVYEKLLLDEPSAQKPVYIIGSEVPIPGGAKVSEDALSVTTCESCLDTLDAFQKAYEALGLQDAWERVAAVVVQPGVEFGDNQVFIYQREKALHLRQVLETRSICFEGHSTDYQTASALRQMVEDGVCILKVGPALTFALREALYALELIERELVPDGRSHFREVLERKMLEEPKYWEKYYHGSDRARAFARAYSFSDRSRYYMSTPELEKSVDTLLTNLEKVQIPITVISQYFPVQYRRIRNGSLRPEPMELLLDRIGDCIDDYLFAMGAV